MRNVVVQQRGRHQNELRHGRVTSRDVPRNWTFHPADTTESQLAHRVLNDENDGAPWLLLLHGFSDDGGCWVPWAESSGLADRFRILAPDAPGHGHSPIGQPGLDLANDVDRVRRLLDELAITSVIVMGHSMGALAASLLASRHPDVVVAVLVEDPVWRLDVDLTVDRRPVDGSEHELLVGLKQQQAQTEAERRATIRSENPRWDEAEVEPWSVSKTLTDVRFFDGPMIWAPAAWQETVKKIRVPTLLITGNVDLGAIVGDDGAEVALHLLAQGERLHQPDASHSIHRDFPESVAQSVHAFLDRCGFKR
jgi:N-formylmaleamate deformylase